MGCSFPPGFLAVQAHQAQTELLEEIRAVLLVLPLLPLLLGVLVLALPVLIQQLLLIGLCLLLPLYLYLYRPLAALQQSPLQAGRMAIQQIGGVFVGRADRHVQSGIGPWVSSTVIVPRFSGVSCISMRRSPFCKAASTWSAS